MSGFSSSRPFRGALVTLANNQVGANYSAGAAIPFDLKAFDTDGIWSAGAGTRLTVPAGAGVNYIQLIGNCYLNNVTADTDGYLYITKAGTQAVVGMGNSQMDITGTSPRANVVSAPLAVTAGDWFDLRMTIADASIDVNEDLTWFAMIVLG
jgi:hypothetical protein